MKLFYNNNCSAGIATSFAIKPQFVSDFSGTQNHALAAGNLGVLHHGLAFQRHKGIGIMAAVAVFKTEHRGFRQNGVISLKPGLSLRKMVQRDILLLILSIDQHGMAMIESAATTILPRETNRNSFR